MRRYKISQFGPNQAQIARFPKRGIFGRFPFHTFDIAVMSHHHAKFFKKSLERIPRTKQTSFFGPKIG